MILETILEMLKYIVPSIMVLLASVMTIQSMFKDAQDKRKIELMIKFKRESLPLRLQAYERMAVLLERISPVNLIQRIRTQNMTGKELQIGLVSAIRQEYEHNISQQIYVSPEVWGAVNLVKDQTIKIINLLSVGMPEDANSMELSKKLLSYIIENEHELSSQQALNIIKIEVSNFF